MTKKRQRKGPKSCPKCGSLEVVPIFYGLPGGPEVMEAAKEGKDRPRWLLRYGQRPAEAVQGLRR
jgi:hypothetical protein